MSIDTFGLGWTTTRQFESEIKNGQETGVRDQLTDDELRTLAMLRNAVDGLTGNLFAANDRNAAAMGSFIHAAARDVPRLIAEVTTLRAELDIAKLDLAAVRTTIDAVKYAAHMPDDYQYGLLSWINQELYVKLTMLLDRDGRVIRRSEDIEKMYLQEKELARLAAELAQARALLARAGAALNEANEFYQIEDPEITDEPPYQRMLEIAEEIDAALTAQPAPVSAEAARAAAYRKGFAACQDAAVVVVGREYHAGPRAVIANIRALAAQAEPKP